MTLGTTKFPGRRAARLSSLSRITGTGGEGSSSPAPGAFDPCPWPHCPCGCGAHMGCFIYDDFDSGKTTHGTAAGGNPAAAVSEAATLADRTLDQ